MTLKEMQKWVQVWECAKNPGSDMVLADAVAALEKAVAFMKKDMVDCGSEECDLCAPARAFLKELGVDHA